MLKFQMKNIAVSPLVKGIFFTITVIVAGCSNKDYNPEDYYQSLLSGEYGKGTLWTLNTILNGDTIHTDGYVRFDSKYLKEGDFRFVNVIPGESSKVFKNVELSATERGCSFVIDYPRHTDAIHITGTVSLGEMTVDMTMSE